MPIIASDLPTYLSGGAANTNPLLSLGGIESTTVVPAGLFDNVSSGEAAAGDVEYRCFYVKNTHATLTLTGAKVWMFANTPSADTTIEIGLGTTAVGTGNEQTVADEQTAPSGVTFSAAANEGAALTIGDIAPGQHKAVWARRTVNAAAAAANDTYTIRFKGDTLP